MAFIITAVLAVWAWFMAWPGPLFALFIIGVFSILLFGFNQFYGLRKKRARGFATMSNEKIYNILMQWLNKEGWSTKTQQRLDKLFQIHAEDSRKRAIIIARPKNEDSFIFIGGSWEIPQETQTTLDNLSEQAQEEMLSELRIEVARLGLDYSGLERPLKKIGLQTRLACDETVTRELFMRQVVTIRNIYIIVIVIINRAIYRAGHIPDKAPAPPK